MGIRSLKIQAYMRKKRLNPHLARILLILLVNERGADPAGSEAPGNGSGRKRSSCMSKQYDCIFTNGKIFTSDEKRPYADAMAVKDGRIAWIGEEKDLPGEGVKRVDLGAKRVLPGIVDNHMHPCHLAGTMEQIACLPPNVYSIAEIMEQVREKAAAAKPGEWILGWGYDEGKYREKRAPLRSELDEAAPNNPVALVRTCFHIACVNSRALELMGITKDTPDPVGGRIDHDEKGELTGILREKARFMLMDIIPKDTPDEMAAKLAKLSDLLLSHGITAVSEAGGDSKPVDCYEIYAKAAEMGMKQRVAIYYFWDQMKDDPKPIPLERRDNTKQIFVGGVKLIGDGSVSGQTAWCDQPYLNTDACGFPVATEEDVMGAGAFARENGVQLKYHAMGAKAIDRAVNAFYQEENWMKDGRPCVRIEHSAMASEQAMDRCARSGIAMTVQPIFLYCEIESYLTNLGPERTKTTYPTKTMLEKGVLTAFSSDAPATSWADPSDPFIGMKGAVTRVAYDGTDTGAAQRVDIRTAVELYTRESQKILGVADVGRLAEGLHADFIVLDRDVLEIPSEEIDQVKVDATYMGGEAVYVREK